MEMIYKCKYCNSLESKTEYSKIKDWEYGSKGVFSYEKCMKCEGIQIHPFPHIEELKEAYNIDYHGYELSQNKGLIFKILFYFKNYIHNKKLSKICPPNSKILDIGCGTGEYLDIFKKFGASILDGIDFNEKAINQVRKKGFNGYLGTFENFHQKDDYYNIIIMNNYLEHTIDPVYELKKSFQLLNKKNGNLIGEVPGFDSFERKIFKRFWGGNHVPRHTFQFNQFFLKKIILESGFKNVKIKHELNTGHLALSIQNRMQRNVEDLKNNKKLNKGRSKWYFPLLILFIPINIISVIFRKSGVIKFYAST